MTARPEVVSSCPAADVVTAKREQYRVVDMDATRPARDKNNASEDENGDRSDNTSAAIKAEFAEWLKQEEEETKYKASTAATEADAWLQYLGWAEGLAGSQHGLAGSKHGSVEMAAFAAMATATGIAGDHLRAQLFPRREHSSNWLTSFMQQAERGGRASEINDSVIVLPRSERGGRAGEISDSIIVLPRSGSGSGHFHDKILSAHILLRPRMRLL